MRTRFRGSARLLWVVVPAAAVLAWFGANMLLWPDPIPAPEWQVNTIEDPQVGVRYAPNSTATTSYPDNPRGYFEQTNPIQETWSLETHAGSQAHLEHVSSDVGSMRVTIPRLAGEEAWMVKLQRTGFQITRGSSYVLKFRAKADAARRISCVVGHNHEPWGILGLYADVDVQPEWKAFECPFVATDSDANARIFFNLAISATPVELSDVVLHNQSTGMDEAPATPPARFLVRYRFNSLGFRGPDRAVPRPPDTYRILALGGSYANGAGVHEQDTFEAQLEKRLNNGEGAGSAATRYEVINGGVSPYTTRQQLRSYELFSSNYEPQVVLAVMAFNDDMSYAYSDSLLALKELNQACRRRGARLAVVLFTNAPSFEPWERLAAAVTEEVRGTDIPVLNLEDALFRDGRTENDLSVHPTDGHPNDRAHRIAAEEIERFLRAENLLP